MKGVLSFLGGAVGWIAANLGIVTAIFPHIGQGVVSAIAGISAVLAALGIHAAGGTPSPITALIDKLGRGWKTILGSVTAVVGYLLGVVGTLPPGVAHVVTVLGTVLAAVGLYHKQAISGGAIP